MGGAAKKKPHLLVSIKSSWVGEAAICRVFSSCSCEWEFSKRCWRGLSQFLLCMVEVVILHSKAFYVNRSMFAFLKLFQEKKRLAPSLMLWGRVPRWGSYVGSLCSLCGTRGLCAGRSACSRLEPLVQPLACRVSPGQHAEVRRSIHLET